MRGWRSWFARGASGYLFGPYGSCSAAEAASAQDRSAVEPGIFGRNEAASRAARRHSGTSPSDFPDAAACIEDFDEDEMWGVWWITLRSGADLFFVGTPDGPLPELYDDRRRCRLAAVAAKAIYDRT